jgi:hypothetical protein
MIQPAYTKRECRCEFAQVRPGVLEARKLREFGNALSLADKKAMCLFLGISIYNKIALFFSNPKGIKS